MEFKWMIVFLLQINLTIVISSRMVANDSFSRQEESVRLERETSYLEKSHAIMKTIQSEDGDIIDCVDIYKQPAFNHPALRDHKIQLRPSFNIKMEEAFDEKMSVIRQKWHASGSCPKGTVPIRRNTHSNYCGTRKTPTYHYKKFNESDKLYLRQENHSAAFLHAEGFAYLGAKGDIRVWNPQVEGDDEYSTSHVALKSGPYYGYEAIESGWAVNPRVYGDRQTRLFVYWTADGSKKTGCFDLTCPGFVQTNHEISLGAAIYPISKPFGLPYQITIYIHKDPNTSNWWVQYGERTNIGYWPHDLFGMLRAHAETVQWGGEVYSSRVGIHPHTATQMGSGHFADYVMGQSGYVKRIRVLLNNMILRFPQWVFTYSDEYECYDTYYISDYVQDPEFYFGGPGQNPRCP